MPSPTARPVEGRDPVTSSRFSPAAPTRRSAQSALSATMSGPTSTVSPDPEGTRDDWRNSRTHRGGVGYLASAPDLTRATIFTI